MFGREPEGVLFPNPDSSFTNPSPIPKKYANMLRARLSKAYESVQLYLKKQQHQELFYKRDVRGSPYQVGDIVFLHDPVVKGGVI